MTELKKFAFGLRHAMVASLAALTFSSASNAQDVPGQSAFRRGLEHRAQSISHFSSQAKEYRQQLNGEVITRPMIVQAPVGTTIVSGVTAINTGMIDAIGAGATAAQLDVRCPVRGGRIMLHGNRIINHGFISANGKGATAAQMIKRCDNRINEASSIMQTRFDNSGRIRAIN